ncbi:hypothetical protein B5F54_11910 [Anaeromassilibacillus sp. An250]|jgi:hypothetical protein|nr:hypothetical protein B5F54_11910 [Anaeromassilibacillus sp. An250]
MESTPDGKLDKLVPAKPPGKKPGKPAEAGFWASATICRFFFGKGHCTMQQHRYQEGICFQEKAGAFFFYRKELL